MMKFNIDIAINDAGNCHNQKVNCENCLMGEHIFKSKGKDKIEDMCKKDVVYFCSVLLKSFEAEK